MRTLIAGAGAIGSLIASYLVEETELWLLGRSWHLDPIKRKEYLTVVLPNGEEKRITFTASTLATNPEALDVKDFDVVIVTVKAYDTKALLRQLRDAGITADCFVLFQNGLGNEALAREILPEQKPLLRGITNNGAHIPTPGKVVHAGRGKTMLGGVSRTFEEWSTKLVNLFKESRLEATYEKDMKHLIWEKIAINAVINPLTALLNVKNKAISEFPNLRRLSVLILKEIEKVAKAENVKLKETVPTVLSIAEKTGENWSSMAQDIKQGNRTEIDFLNGAVVEKARKHDISTPINNTLYLLVKALEEKTNLESSLSK